MMALASANSAPMVKVSVPGLVTISTPKNPTRIADQRATPTVSRRKMIEASVAKIGAEKLIATALASGISENAIIRNVCEVDCEAPRSRWPLRRWVWNTARPGARQDDDRKPDQRNEHAREQHLADRIGLDQPFRQRAGAGEDEGRARASARSRASRAPDGPAVQAPGAAAGLPLTTLKGRISGRVGWPVEASGRQ